MVLLLYNILLFIFAPVIGLFLLWRRAIGKEDADNWGERWGKYPETVRQDPRTPRIWIHAVSVGEVMAAIPVLRELRRRYPDAFILLSTTTTGGREVALKQVPPADNVVYYPLDFPVAARRALRNARPDIILLMEWEIWPNLLAEAKRQGAKTAVLNGRISDRGLRRANRIASLLRPVLHLVDFFAMQSEMDRERALALWSYGNGPQDEPIANYGNTKFDESAAMLTPEERIALRADLGIPDGEPVWVCGSTRPGEEEIIAVAAEIVRRSFPTLFLIVAPRHLERADEAAAPFGDTIRRRSRQKNGESSPTSILLLDTFGELARVYAVADVAFIGGSLLPFGGQSVFQPLAQGVPALFGPYMNNQRDIAALSTAEGVGFMVNDAATLAVEVVRLLSLSPQEKQALGAKARGLIDRNQGVAARCADRVEKLLALE